MRDELLIVFLKAPRLGTVKTRLAATMGAPAAGAACRRLVETLLQRLSSLEYVELRFAPDDSASEIKPWARPSWRLAAQGEGDLGCRLDRAAREAFASETRRVVIIGSDCPEVTAADVRAAWTALHTYDVVLGPATDGGYWLIGLRAPRPDLFEGISWSTSAVLNETLVRASIAGLTVHILRELSDVDTEADWRRFLGQEGEQRLG